MAGDLGETGFGPRLGNPVEAELAPLLGIRHRPDLGAQSELACMSSTNSAADTTSRSHQRSTAPTFMKPMSCRIRAVVAGISGQRRHACPR
jgi:hypothetical protein